MSLSQLPPELVDRIAYFSDFVTLGALRLTNRETKDKVSNDYVTRVLTQSWPLREDSLNTLMAVAESERFRNKITTLRIDPCTIGHWVGSQREYDEASMQRYIALRREQEDFHEYGRPMAMLMTALSKLPLLRCIEIGESKCLYGERAQIGWDWHRLNAFDIIHLDSLSIDLEAPTDGRSILNAASEAWRDSHTDYDVTFGVAYHLSVLLTALSITQQRIKQLTVGGFAGHTPAYIPVSRMQTLDGSAHLYRGLRAAFVELERVEMNLTWMTDEGEGDENWLKTLLCLIPSLRMLLLRFRRSADHVAWLNRSWTVNLLGNTHFKHLTCMDIEGMAVGSEPFHDFLRLHVLQLRTLILRGVSIFRQCSGSRHGWLEILGLLRQTTLATLTLSHLVEQHRGWVVIFNQHGSRDCEHCGRKMWTSDREELLLYSSCDIHLAYNSDNGKMPEDFIVAKREDYLSPEDIARLPP